MRFRKAGTKKARLRLTKRGRHALATCAQRELTVRARGAFVRTSFRRDPQALQARAGPAAPTSQSSPGGPLTGTRLPGRFASTGTIDSYGTSAMPATRCDPIDPSVCLQPCPNDEFTTADPSTDTGRRLDLRPPRCR